MCQQNPPEICHSLGDDELAISRCYNLIVTIWYIIYLLLKLYFLPNKIQQDIYQWSSNRDNDGI